MRPWVPYGDDPFVWFDPSEDMKLAEAAPARAPEAAPIAKSSEVETDIWVELPAVEEAPRRNRRARGRVRQAEEPEVAASEASPVEVAGAVEPVVDSAPEAAPEPEAPPAPARRSRARKSTAAEVVETVEPVAVVAEPEPVAVEPPPAPTPVEPDPAEISGPPPAPKRGWWRRG